MSIAAACEARIAWSCRVRGRRRRLICILLCDAHSWCVQK